MTAKTEGLSDALHAYLVAHGSTPDPLVADLIAETRASLPDRAQMQVAPEQARFLTLFTQIIGASYAVEVGTFTGLSSIAIGRGLPVDGRLVCCPTGSSCAWGPPSTRSGRCPVSRTST